MAQGNNFVRAFFNRLTFVRLDASGGFQPEGNSFLGDKLSTARGEMYECG